MRYRGSIAKWILLAFAILITFPTLADRTAAFGSLSGALWISFAVLHAGDRLAKARERVVEPPAATQLPPQA